MFRTAVAESMGLRIFAEVGGLRGSGSYEGYIVVIFVWFGCLVSGCFVL